MLLAADGTRTLRLGIDAESAGWYEYIIGSYSMFLDWQSLYDSLLRLDETGRARSPSWPSHSLQTTPFTEFKVN